MALTISTKTYNFDTNPSPDSAKYIGPAQTSVIKDSVVLKRTAPKPTKDFAGVVRVAVKTVKNVLINGVYRDVLAETVISYPVGADATTVTAIRVDHSSALAAAPTQTLVDNSKITY